MRIKRVPEDFQIEELLQFPGERGAYAYYRVEKNELPTTLVRELMAAHFKVTPSLVVFPALKDTTTFAIQYASVRKRNPEEFSGEGFVAQRVQFGPRALRPSDLVGNRFTITIRDLAETEAAALNVTLQTLATYGLPNYFDTQCFGSQTALGFIGKTILLRDAEAAVQMYLAEPMQSDAADLCTFKLLVKENWGQWGYLLHLAPRPSNFRSVITFLKDHPHEYRKALNLIQERLLTTYLSAYQAWIWNQVLGLYLEKYVPSAGQIEIAGKVFPLPAGAQVLDKVRELAIDLPRMTALYEESLVSVVDTVLAQEGITLHDLKARILQRVYLSKGERPAWFMPAELTLAAPVPDTYYPGRWAVTARFMLAPGSYAILLLTAAAAQMGVPLVVGSEG